MLSKTLLAVVLTLSFSAAYAQSEEQVLNSDPIDVDGYLHEKQVTDGELEQIKSEIRKQKTEVQLNKEKSKGFKELSKTTEKLSDTTEEYLGDKKDAQKEIAEYNKKIKCLMAEQPGPECDKYVKNRKEEPEVQEVQVQQAAPVAAVVEAPAPVVGPDLNKPMEEIKLIPFAGATNYSGEREQLQTELSAGMRLESNVSPRLSVGFGFNYASLKTEDFANSSFGTQPWANQYYGNNFYGAQGREIQFKTMGLDLYGKFFITRGERFRPYLGAGLGYNQASLKYSENSPFQIQSYNFGDETFKSSYASGRLMAGTEVMVSQSVGLNVEAGYSTGFGNGFGKEESKNPTTSPDQRRLKELGEEIINANALSIFAGAVIIF